MYVHMTTCIQLDTMTSPGSPAGWARRLRCRLGMTRLDAAPALTAGLATPQLGDHLAAAGGRRHKLAARRRFARRRRGTSQGRRQGKLLREERQDQEQAKRHDHDRVYRRTAAPGSERARGRSWC